MRIFAVSVALVAVTSTTVSGAPALLKSRQSLDVDLDFSASLSTGVSGIYTQCTSPGQIALTFDDGPYTYGDDIVNALNAQGVKGTFFVNANNWACIYDYADELLARYQAGHVIGSHSGTHPDIATLTADELNTQLDLVEGALQNILGVVPRFFRPPYGSVSQANVDVLTARGYVVANWNFDSGDSSGVSPAETIQDYSLLSPENSYIALNHETYESTASTVIPSILPVLLQNSFQVVDLATCLGQSAYQSVGSPGVKDESWTCAGMPAPGQT